MYDMHDIYAEIDFGKAGKVIGKGNIQLTTRRVVFHNTVRTDDDPFESYQMPLHKIFANKLVQQVFGSNYFQCKVTPSEEHKYELPENHKPIFKAYFTSGGFDNFMKRINQCLDFIREKNKDKKK